MVVDHPNIAFDDEGHPVPFCEPTAEPDFGDIPPQLADKVEKYIDDQVSAQTAEALLKFCIEAAGHGNVKLHILSTLYAIGATYLEGMSEVDIAKKCGVTKQAVSARVRDIKETFGLRKSRNMRSDTHRQKFRAIQKENSNERSKTKKQRNADFFARLSQAIAGTRATA